jgi:hypothetical protein
MHSKGIEDFNLEHCSVWPGHHTASLLPLSLLFVVWLIMLFFGRSTVFLVDLELVAQMMHPCAVHYERRGREGSFIEARSAKEERNHGEFQKCSCSQFHFVHKMRPGRQIAPPHQFLGGPIWKP